MEVNEMFTKWTVITVLLVLLLTAGVAVAQGSLSLSWSSLQGGGGASQGGNYSIEGTVGQANAGNLSGGDYTLLGGYWIPDTTSDTPTGVRVFLPTVMR
jgi:hypothetical protein